MRLVIGGPTLATVPASFAVDLAHLYVFTGNDPVVSMLWLRFVQSTYVHVGREAVLEAALQVGATHVLWLDTDMSFPADTALRLSLHNKSVVACNCVMKTEPPLFTAQRNGQRIASGPDAHGLEAVDSVGMAVMLMRTDIVADLLRPWFVHGRSPSGADVGEDIGFCQALRAHGHEIWIDHDLSKEIGHIGQYTYRPAREAEVAV